MKVLCLHGYGQHTESIKNTFSGIEKILKAEYHYIIAPHSVINFKKENGFAWFTVSEASDADGNSLEAFFNSKKYYGIQESIEKIKTYIKENGPFDGLIGFSQGSVMATIILGAMLYPFKWAFIIGSYSPTDLDYILYNKITTPTLLQFLVGFGRYYCYF